MNKIDKAFQNGEVLFAEDLNPLVAAINNNIDAINALASRNYKFAGRAAIEDEPGEPSMSVFRIASAVGTYTGYGLEVTAEDGVCAFTYDVAVETPAWYKLPLGIPFPKPTGMMTENVETGTIEAESNHYYNVMDDVEVLNLTLPEPEQGLTDIVKVHCIVGAQPSLNITAGVHPVRIIDVKLEHHREYIFTCFYDGAAWLVTANCLTPTNCLVFQSAEPFEIRLLNGTQDGSVEYSTDGRNWTKLSGNSTIRVTSVVNGLRYNVMLRGMNTVVGNLDEGFSILQGISGENVQCVGDIKTLLNYEHPDEAVLGTAAFAFLFQFMEALSVAPDLTAKTLSEGCYTYMFFGCSTLAFIKMLATDITASSCLTSWATNVHNTGIFVKAAAMEDLPIGNNGIPAGWTVEDE